MDLIPVIESPGSHSSKDVPELTLSPKDEKLAEIEVYDTVMYQPEAVLTAEMRNFQIFPNPAPGKYITLTGLSVEGRNQINILNIIGELTNDYLVEGTKINLDLSNLNTGVYFIQVKNNLYNQTRKLII